MTANESKDTTSNINNQQTPPEIKVPVVDNIDEQKQSTNIQNVQVTSPHRSLIQRIDEHLRIYYQQHDQKDYYDNDTQCGKFKTWCEENEYYTDTLIEEFNGDIEDACFTDFDDNFPFKPQIDEDKKAERIF
eukprot:384434_1